MMNALRTETDNPGATHKLVCGCDFLSPKTQSSRARYDSFGNQVRHCDAPAAETSAAAPYKLARLNPYRYAAREWLSLDWSASSALGLSDNRARFYDPTLASFLQEDPLWNSNPYTYVGNNPVGFIDPYGKEEVKVWGSEDEKRQAINYVISQRLTDTEIIRTFNPTTGTDYSFLRNLEVDTIFGKTDLDWALTLAYYSLENIENGESKLFSSPKVLYVAGKLKWAFQDKGYTLAHLKTFMSIEERRAVLFAELLLSDKYSFKDLFNEVWLYYDEDIMPSNTNQNRR
ncbi:MAG TPA: RHS repeat-associated core domain-containing protein [bacterium]|nr:RHS repeat-associated core domain-containing protein [bacterium]